MGFYVDEADRSARSAPANEAIPVGTACTRVGGLAELLDGSTNTDFDGVADSPRRGDYIAEESDESSDYTYQPASAKDANSRGGEISDRVPLRGDEDGAVIRIKTPEDNGTDPAPDISPDDVVGVAAVGTSEFEGRIVQEGYTDNAATEYSESGAGDFVPLGEADRFDSSDPEASVTEFDTPVKLKVES